MVSITCSDLHEVVRIIDAVLDEGFLVLITFEHGFYTIDFIEE